MASLFNSSWPLRVHRPAYVGLSGGILLVVVLAYTTFEFALSRQFAAERATLEARTASIGASLSALIARHRSLPEIVSLERALAEALQAQGDPARISAANAYLSEVRAKAGVEAVFLIDATGNTIASSNHDAPDSFVGHHYGFRPYYLDALRTGVGRFFAEGATTRRPGYFLSARVGAAGARTTGVVVLKVSLDEFEGSLRDGAGIAIAVADESGVVILSNRPEWKYRTLGRLSGAARTHIDVTRQFPDRLLDPIADDVDLGASDVWRAADGAPTRLVVRARIDSPPWTIVGVDEASMPRQIAALSASAAALGGLVVIAGGHIFAMRRRRGRELRDAEVEIERRIARQTARLVEQVEAQARTESLLRQTQDAAVQAGKLAMLGQMAAGIVHEITQPLTAIRGYSENARDLLGAGHVDAALANLAKIDGIVGRAASIVRQFTVYGRAAPGSDGPADVGAAIESALQLLAPGAVDTRRVRVQRPAEPLLARIEPVQLVQVLVNLLRNALETGDETGPVDLSLRYDDGYVLVAVRDRGTGLSDEALSRLFEPFFTTKPAGRGLGLGLAVSRMIVEGARGRLEGRNRDEGRGAEFVVRLRAANRTTRPDGEPS